MSQSGKLWLAWLVIGSAIASWENGANAQITPDTTLGNENSSVTPTATVDFINGGATRGANLFHSFGEFNVGERRAAVFTNPVGIENIITRVTGANPSNIFGTLGIAGNANLFLINPNGILFGANARLDIRGSFVGTTANALQFSNLGLFSATDKNIPAPLLTIKPSALLFNQINQNARIQNNSVAPAGRDPAGFAANGLRVPNGKSLLLVGGNVSMNGGELNAYGGRVELGGLSESGTIALGVNGDNLSLKFPENVARASVSLTNSSSIYVEGAGGGSIAVNAKNLEILGRSVLSGGIGEGLGTPETVAGDITLNATGEIKVAGTRSIVINRTALGAKGNGGNITIDSGSLSLRDRAILQASTFGQGNGGNITIDSGSLSLRDSAILASTVGQGNGGNITIDSGSLSLRDGALLGASTFGQGNAGNVTVSAKDTVSLTYAAILSTVEAGGVGKGGNIDINAATLSLIDGGQLLTITRGASATQPAGRGNAGNVNVKVTGTVDIAGEKNGSRSTISSEVRTGTVGNGGNITIDSSSLFLRDRALLAALTLGQGNAGNVTVRAKDTVSLASNTAILSTVEAGGVGKGGDIDINAATLSLIEGAQLQTLTRGASNTQPPGQGNAGNVNVKVIGAVDIAGEKNGSRSAISSQVNTGTVGNGGNITIDSGSLSLRDGALLGASTFGQGNAGIIKVNAADFVTISGIDSGLFVNSQSPTGTAGDIIVTSPRVTLDSSGTFSAQSASGNGGNINLNVRDLLLLRRGAQISTTAGTAQAGGNGGNINIDTPSGFIVAGVRENNDITANAFSGIGGQIAINTSGIFGIQRQERDTPQSDITASSQFGINGVVNINTPDVDPSRGLVALPAELTDVSGLIAQGCGASRTTQGQSKFIVTGRGGLPPNPSDTINSDAVWIDLDSTTQLAEARPRSRSAIQPTNSMPDQLVEATGWALNDKGQVVLTAYASATPPPSPGLIAAKCHVP